MWLMVLGVSLLWVVVLYLVGPKLRQSGSFGDQNVRYPASYDWTLYDLENQPVRFDKFKGKTIFLNIWATWCPPCIAEMPSIAKLAENPRFKGKGIEFICVATDESASDVSRYLQGKNWGMTVLRAESMPEAYLSEGIPATYAISPEGIVVGAVVGSSDWDTPEVVEFLEKLAAPDAEATRNR
jgi:thiol-disulfide isomerase/thioredoxin